MEIQNYPNYLIYNDGRVFSKKNKRFLNPYKTKLGYLHIDLFNEEGRKVLKVHRLVAMHYIPNPENKPQVDHINRIRDDNRVENLRFVSNLENCNNTGEFSHNKSGYKNIFFKNEKINKQKWIFSKKYNRKKTWKRFYTLSDALCYKYIFNLKIRAGLV